MLKQLSQTYISPSVHNHDRVVNNLFSPFDSVKGAKVVYTIEEGTPRFTARPLRFCYITYCNILHDNRIYCDLCALVYWR
jgi:hypothetical protein